MWRTGINFAETSGQRRPGLCFEKKKTVMFNDFAYACRIVIIERLCLNVRQMLNYV